MALICPACGTENRSVAKFCIECIGRLPVDFAPTQVSAPPLPPEEAAAQSLPPALAAFASAASSPPLPLGWGEQPSIPLPIKPPPRRPHWWPPALGAAICLLALGWGVGRLLDEGVFATPPVSAEGARTATGAVQAERPAEAAPAPDASAPREPPPAAQDALGPGEALVTEGPASAASAPEHPAPAAPVAARAARTTKADKGTVSGSSLFAACEGLGFVSASRCRVNTCSAPATRARSECAPVLAEQRRLDEKRNPGLSN